MGVRTADGGEILNAGNGKCDRGGGIGGTDADVEAGVGLGLRAGGRLTKRRILSRSKVRSPVVRVDEGAQPIKPSRLRRAAPRLGRITGS